jgi:hypothetical protein
MGFHQTVSVNPQAIAIYLLDRIRKTLRELTSSLHKSTRLKRAITTPVKIQFRAK